MSFGVRIKGAEGLQEYRAKLRRSVRPALVRGMLRAAHATAGDIKREISAWTSGSTGRKTGALLRDWRPTLTSSSVRSTVRVTSSLPYAHIHEAGGTIVPVRGQWLTIPMTPLASKVSARQFPGKLTFIQSSPSTAVLRDKSGRVQYVLKRRVTISAKRYVERGLARSLPTVERIIGETIAKAIEPPTGKGR